MVINLESQTELSGFYIIFNGSTNLEKDGIFGISHLMEHLVCKSFEHLRPKFENYGIHWNAYTTNNEIVFFFTGLDKYLERWRNELVDVITNFDVTKKDFEKEKKIVLQEYNLNFGDQSKSHLLNLNRKLYRDYRPIGKRSDLENMNFMDCLDFFEKQFSSPYKIINVSKYNKFTYDFEPSRPVDLKEYTFGPYNDVELEPLKKSDDKISIILMSKPTINDFNYINFINSMLSMGLSSPLYKEIREKRGLVYGIGATHQRMNDIGSIIINTETSTKNKNEVIDSIKDILSNPSKYLTPKRYELTKNAYKINYLKDKIDRYQNVNLWINPKDWSVKNILSTMSYEKVMEVYDDAFDLDNFYVSDDRTEFT